MGIVGRGNITNKLYEKTFFQLKRRNKVREETQTPGEDQTAQNHRGPPDFSSSRHRHQMHLVKAYVWHQTRCASQIKA